VRQSEGGLFGGDRTRLDLMDGKIVFLDLRSRRVSLGCIGSIE
jgi:hypothetical protein